MTAFRPPASAETPLRCNDPGSGWCVARRFSGDIPNGELGFRFGEPLDVDGDGVADLAAGSRFKRVGHYQAGTAGVWSGADGHLIRRWEGPADENGIFGHWVLPVPDLSGDGLADVAISAPNAPVAGVMHGSVSVRSPKTGKEVWHRVGAPDSQFGWDVAIAGDLNRDGIADLFVGEPGTPLGRVHLVNGRDGTTIRTYGSSVATSSFGWYVARLDDLDGDGMADLAVAAPPGYTADAPPNGAAYVISSATGRALHQWQGTAPGPAFGEMVAALGDLDGDGRGEVAVSAPGTMDQTRSLVGEVYVYSSATGAELQRFRATEKGDLFGRLIVGAGDIDGDGVDDLAIGAPWHRSAVGDRVGRVELRSGKSGAALAELVGEGAESWFGWHIRRAPDPEGRGRPALLIGSLRQPVDGQVATGVIDLWVLRRPDSSSEKTTAPRSTSALRGTSIPLRTSAP